MKRRITLAAGLAATTLALAACSNSNDHDTSAMNHGSGQGMPGMNHDNGLSATKDGFTLVVKHGPAPTGSTCRSRPGE